MSDVQSLQDRVMALAKLRTEEGYMAAATNEGDGFLLVENHCPIRSAAKSCTGLCAMELDVFQSVLGEGLDQGVKVQRIDHILSGARRCAYKITYIT